MAVIKKTLGAVITPFVKDDSVKLKNHFAYYGNTQLTDQYYIINNVYIADDGKLYRSGIHQLYICGDISEGDFISTSKLHGICQKVINRDLAFAVAKESYDSYTNGKVGLIHVVLL